MTRQSKTKRRGISGTFFFVFFFFFPFGGSPSERRMFGGVLGDLIMTAELSFELLLLHSNLNN